MKRRDFVALSGTAAMAGPLVATAQQSAGVRKIGVLLANASDAISSSGILSNLRQGLKALGWTEGQNVQFDVHYPAGGDYKLLPSLAVAMVSKGPDVIVAVSSPVAVALKRATREIPIVFMRLPDPVALGLVDSIAKPGGNITGFTDYDYSMGTKWLQLLKEIAPRITRVGLVFSPEVPSSGGLLHLVEVAARTAGLAALEIPLRNPDDMQRISALGAPKDLGLVTFPIAISRYGEIIKLAAQHRLPAIYGLRGFTLGGGLMSYDSDSSVDARQVAGYVDHILRGAKPAELPVQNPIKFDLVINAKTAKALRLTVPQSLLLQAVQVIR